MLIKPVVQKSVHYKRDYCIKMAHVSEFLDSFNRLFFNAYESKCSVWAKMAYLSGMFIYPAVYLCGVHCICKTYSLCSVLLGYLLGTFVNSSCDIKINVNTM